MRVPSGHATLDRIESYSPSQIATPMSPRVAVDLLFAALSGLFLLNAGREFRNVSRSPVVGRSLRLALLCFVLAVMFYFIR